MLRDRPLTAQPIVVERVRRAEREALRAPRVVRHRVDESHRAPRAQRHRQPIGLKDAAQAVHHAAVDHHQQMIDVGQRIGAGLALAAGVAAYRFAGCVRAEVVEGVDLRAGAEGGMMI